MAVCRRYLGNGLDAEDTLMESFMKVFSKVETFNEAGSFEGWIRRIVVNECLMKIRKQGDVFTKNIEEAWDVGEPADALMHLRTAEIEALIAELPPGYRTIFNLYAIEGYSHDEIATLLAISSGTSKSQLSRARTMIQQKIKLIESRKSQVILLGKRLKKLGKSKFKHMNQRFPRICGSEWENS